MAETGPAELLDAEERAWAAYRGRTDAPRDVRDAWRAAILALEEHRRGGPQT